MAKKKKYLGKAYREWLRRSRWHQRYGAIDFSRMVI